jgi:hypothetical protein
VVVAAEAWAAAVEAGSVRLSAARSALASMAVQAAASVLPSEQRPAFASGWERPLSVPASERR